MAGAASLPLQHPPPLLGAPRSRQLSGGARSPAGSGAAGGVRSRGAGRARSRRGRTRVSTLSSRACAPLCATGSPSEAQASRVPVLRTLLPPRRGENQPQNLEVEAAPIRGSFGTGAEEKRSQKADPRLRRRKDSGSRCRHVASPKAPRIVWIARCASQLDGTPPLASAPFPLGGSSPDPGGTSTCKGAGQSQVPGAHHASQQLRAAGRSW